MTLYLLFLSISGILTFILLLSPIEQIYQLKKCNQVSVYLTL